MRNEPTLRRQPKLNAARLERSLEKGQREFMTEPYAAAFSAKGAAYASVSGLCTQILLEIQEPSFDYSVESVCNLIDNYIDQFLIELEERVSTVQTTNYHDTYSGTSLRIMPLDEQSEISNTYLNDENQANTYYSTLISKLELLEIWLNYSFSKDWCARIKRCWEISTTTHEA